MSLAKSLLDLTPQERIYVESRLQGLSQKASAAAAGYSHPGTNSTKIEKKPRVQKALVAGMSEVAEEVGFTRKEAHDMLYNAYQNAATAGEQIAAVKEMISLHGIAAPKQVEHKHQVGGTVSLERMETHELLKLAEMEDLTLEGEFEVLDDREKLPKL